MTAEEFIREKIRQKQDIKGSMDALWKYQVNGDDCLRWAHEYMKMKEKEMMGNTLLLFPKHSKKEINTITSFIIDAWLNKKIDDEQYNDIRDFLYDLEIFYKKVKP
jgi:hypothetical protein